MSGGSAEGHEQYYHHGGEHSQPAAYVEVTADPTEATVGRGEKITITCRVKGAEQYKVTWGKYAHDTSLPAYARVCINDKDVIEAILEKIKITILFVFILL